MKQILIKLILTMSFCINAKAQNLVYDGSLEDTILCPQIFNSSIKNILKYWKYSGNISGAVINSCNTNRWGVPQNCNGYEYAHTGNGYINLPTFGGVSTMPDFRQYSIGQLKQTLVQGKKYKVSMYVSLSDSVIFACNNISIYFSDTIPSYNFYDNYKIHFNFTHPVDVNFHQDLSSKVGWTKLDTSFIATGNERWLTIGNFLPDSLSDSVFVGGNLVQTGSLFWDYSFYFIDDVSVELLDKTGINESTNRKIVNFYPNPNNGSFSVNVANNEPAKLELYNVLGELLMQESFTNKIEINATQTLNTGVYLCVVKQGNVVVYQNKMVVQK